jgi:hypothetical protein
MNLDEIALEIARSLFILSAKNKREQVTLFLTDINEWIEREQEWIDLSLAEKEKLIDDAKIYLMTLKENLPLTYDIIVNRILPADHKSIDYLLHGSLI